MKTTPGKTAQLLRDLQANAATLEDATPIKKQLTALGAVAKRYFAAQGVLDKAETALSSQMAAVARADVTQDTCVEKLAVALVSAGEPRTRPFGAFGAPAPSEVRELAYAREAKVCKDLVESVRSAKAPLTKDVESACNALEKTAIAVETEIAKLGPLQEAVADAVTARDQIGLDAHKGIARVRKAAESADADEGTTFRAHLFGSGKVVRKAEVAKGKAAAKRKKAKGGGGGSGGTSGGGK